MLQIKPALDFSISLKPKNITDSYKPDEELTAETLNSTEKFEIYQKYDKSTCDLYDQNNIKELNTFQSSSEEFDLRQASHPVVCIFTMGFKILSALLFFFILPIINSELLAYIILTICVSIDFWYTQKISGRLLVGLIWQNKINLSGDEMWIYESHQCAEASNKVDRAFFWWSLLLSFTFWMIILIGQILSLRLFWVPLIDLYIYKSLPYHCIPLYQMQPTYMDSINAGEHQKKLLDMKLELTKQGMNVVGMVMLNSGKVL